MNTDDAQGDPIRRSIQVALCILMRAIGIGSVEERCLDILVDLLQSFFIELGISSKNTAELCNRLMITPSDVVLSLCNMGFPIVSLFNLQRELFKITAPPPFRLKTPGEEPLVIGRCQQFFPYIPAHLKPFPSSHAYIKTKMLGKVDSGYPAIREHIAQKTEEIEAALSLYMLTVHSAISVRFGNEECKVLPPKSEARPYLSALLPSYLKADEDDETEEANMAADNPFVKSIVVPTRRYST